MMAKKNTDPKINIYTVTLGCPKNRVDTEKLLGQFGKTINLSPDLAEADLVLVNTCAFIQEAIEESLAQIFELHEDLSHINPKPPLVVTGCLVDRFSKELYQELPEVDLWIPIKKQPQFKELIRPFLKKEHTLAQSTNHYPSPARTLTTPPSFAYLKISEGCNQHCSYCTIPFIRGPLHSAPRKQLLLEAQQLLQKGIRELCLVAQDVTAYGLDHGEAKALIALLRDLSELNGVDWLRLLYLYPNRITVDFLKNLQRITPPVLPYFDLPLQHVHPEILRLMNRPTISPASETIARIREIFPDAALRTTIIVGFPGEQDKHFEDLIKFVQETRFTHLGVFCYSPESGTKAAQLSGQVPQAVKEERKKILMGIQRQISKQHLDSFKGQKMPVIIDRPSPEWPSLYEGRTWFQAPEIDGITYVSGQDIRPGELIQVEITDTMDYDLSGLL